MNQTADDLDAAADLLDYKLDWCQGHMTITDEAGTVVAGCAAGAIGLAQGESIDLRRYFHDLETLRRHLGSGHGVGYWNDTPGRTKQEVVDALRLAAKAEREVRP